MSSESSESSESPAERSRKKMSDAMNKCLSAAEAKSTELRGLRDLAKQYSRELKKQEKREKKEKEKAAAAAAAQEEDTTQPSSSTKTNETSRMSKLEKFYHQRDEELQDKLSMLSDLVWNGIAERLLPMRYSPSFTYTLEQFKHIEKDKRRLFHFATTLGMDIDAAIVNDPTLADASFCQELKNRVVRELLERGKLARKGSKEEEEATQQGILGISRTLTILDGVLLLYAQGQMVMEKEMLEKVPQAPTRLSDLFQCAEEISNFFFYSLRERGTLPVDIVRAMNDASLHLARGRGILPKEVEEELNNFIQGRLLLGSGRKFKLR